jgi:hypothetical protein
MSVFIARDLGKIPRCCQINIRYTRFCFTRETLRVEKEMKKKKKDAVHVVGQGLSISCNQHQKFGVWQ